MTLHPAPVRRPGLSLLEVLVAMAILLFSLVAIGHIVTQAGDRALDVQMQSQAIQLCQAKLAEVAAGAVPLTPLQDAPLDDDPDWVWSLNAEQGAVSGLWNVNVRVSRPRPDGTRVTVALSQMVLDPSLRGNNMVAPTTTDTSPSTSDNSNSNSQSNTGSTTTPGGAAASAPAASTGTKPAAGQPAAAPAAAKPAATPAPAPAAAPKPSTPAPAKAPSGPTKGGS